jgi:hypothetical protein
VTQRNGTPSGSALIYLWDGRAYSGDVSIADGFVHFDGQRRVPIDGEVTHRPAGRRTWPRREIREIRWLTSVSVS